jgi:predicted alpha/beta superfamily hydrolase
MKSKLFCLCLILMSAQGMAQLTFVVDDIPANTPDGASIYVVGTFNGWDPGDPAYELMENVDGDFEITFTPTSGTLEFKFTRGSWETVEGNENGGFLPDRTYSYDGSQTTEVFQILSWEDIGGDNSTAADNVEIIDTDFYIPQLDRYRRIWVYVPPDYETSVEHYKVLYMHDGQNLFDAATSFVGEWEVDETLNELFDLGDPGCIVVGIDNGGVHRLDEYSPWYNNTYEAGGEGDDYMEFLVETLKPYIDENYRTLPEREFTGLMGSSMGGLISTFGGIEHSDVFSRIGSFSPSYWFAYDEVEDFISNTLHPDDMRIYSIAGMLEGGSMAADAEDIDAHYSDSGYDDMEHLTVIHDDGEHSEWYWRREFEAAYLWLWEGTNQIEETNTTFVFYPNPVSEILTYDASNFLVGTVEYELCDTAGKTLMNGIAASKGVLDVSGLTRGMYTLKISSGDKVGVNRIVKH